MSHQDLSYAPSGGYPGAGDYTASGGSNNFNSYPGSDGGYQGSGSQGGHGNYSTVPQGGHGNYPVGPQGVPGNYPTGPQGGHGNHPGGYPPSGAIDPQVQQWFLAVDRDRSGHISSKELQAALVNAQGRNFSDSAGRLMIGMFDKDKSGTIDLSEFQLLYNYINQWIATFRSYDRDSSGHIEEPELSQALSQMGYRLSPAFLKCALEKSDPQSHSRMSLDQFIVTCVQLQRFTEAFRSRDTDLKGVVTIGFEDFLILAFSGSL